jgi:flavodoxin
MQTIVVYDSKFGNTEKIAHAIGRGLATLGDTRVISTIEAPGFFRSTAIRPDLVVVGGPTQKRGPSRPLRAFVDDLPATLAGIPAATFDTRYKGATWIMGSAAAEVAKSLRRCGNTLLVPPESFFMSRSGPMERQQLEPGEVDRAEKWARTVVAAAAPIATAARAVGS